jgi:hypothetical protein
MSNMENLQQGHMLSVASNQWASRPDDEKFLSLAELYKARYSKENDDVVKQQQYNMSEFRAFYDDHGELMLEHQISNKGGITLVPTAWSMAQLCTRTRTPYPALKLWQDDGNKSLVVDALNHSFEKRGDDMQLYHQYHNTLYPQTLHAATSEKYTRIFDYEVIERVQRFTTDSKADWKVPGTIDWSNGQHIADDYLGSDQVTKEATTLYAGDRDMFIFLVDDRNPIDLGVTRNGQQDVVFPGFIVGNSTVGYKPIWMMTFYFRGVCMNRCIWGAEGVKEFSHKHLTNVRQNALYGDKQSNDPMKQLGFTDRLKELEKRQQQGRDKTARSIQGAMQVEEFNDDEARHVALRKVEIASTTARKIVSNFEEVESHPILTRWDMHNAITAEARTVTYQNERTKLEKTATRFLRMAA